MGEPGEAQGYRGYYELRQTPGKGRGAFALKDIPAGTRILVDTALFTIEKLPGLISLGDVQRALQDLDSKTRAVFNALEVPSHVQGYPKAIQEHAVFIRNNHEMRGPSTTGCFVHASRFNHSCQPNCVMSSNYHNQKQCYVIANVRKGDELTFAYMEEVQYLTTEERKEYLQNSLGGPCLCAFCGAPAAEREISDLRRKLMRCLLFIMDGEDLNLAIPLETSNEFESQCLAASERFKEEKLERCAFWPMILFAFLAEAEGPTFSSELEYSYIKAIKTVIMYCSTRRIRRAGIQIGAHLRFWAKRAHQQNVLHFGAETLADIPGEQKLAKWCRVAGAINCQGDVPWYVNEVFYWDQR